MSARSCKTGHVDVRPTWALLNDLDAAADDAANVHNLLCGFVPGDPDTEPCSCGIPELLRAAAQVLRAKDAYKLLEAGELGSLAA